ncbi:hypothetical protein KAR91_20755 [Candidatus Pacearchaeota archaeon]|nr:hypothetical protein [Candidatus Pacearchaeota archaeon]
MKKKKKKRLQLRRAFIREFPGDKDDPKGELALIDIKAAIAKQGIPISELYNNQDIASNRSVLTLVSDAEAKIRTRLESEIVVLRANNAKLQKFRDKAETGSLVASSKELADKSPKTVEYIKARLSTGRGVDMSGDLTDEQRQEKINEAIKEELDLIESQGITFKETNDKKPEDDPDVFKDKVGEEPVDMTDPDNNPLIDSDD